ncbi:MAG: hypothetical protein U0414_05860 [Polyangiaceae bacterium]
MGIGKAGNLTVMIGVSSSMIVGGRDRRDRRRGAHRHGGRHRRARPLHLSRARLTRRSRARCDDVRRRRD